MKAITKILKAVKFNVRLVNAKIDIFLGVCPFCNSELPFVINCPVCERYIQANGAFYKVEEYSLPLEPYIRKRWFKKFKVILKGMIYECH